MRVAPRRQDRLLVAVVGLGLRSVNSTKSYDSRLSADTGALRLRYLSWKPRASKGVGVPGLVHFLSEDTGTLEDGDALRCHLFVRIVRDHAPLLRLRFVIIDALVEDLVLLLLLLLGNRSIIINHEVVVAVLGLPALPLDRRARCSAVSPDEGAGRFVSRFTSFGTCVPSRNSNFSFDRSTASSPSSYWIAWRSPSYDATPPMYQAASAGHQTLKRRPTTSAPGPFTCGSLGASA